MWQICKKIKEIRKRGIFFRNTINRVIKQGTPSRCGDFGWHYCAYMHCLIQNKVLGHFVNFLLCIYKKYTVNADWIRMFLKFCRFRQKMFGFVCFSTTKLRLWGSVTLNWSSYGFNAVFYISGCLPQIAQSVTFYCREIWTFSDQKTQDIPLLCFQTAALKLNPQSDTRLLSVVQNR